VRAGETLSHIALKYYGHATPPYYKLIYEFNKNVWRMIFGEAVKMLKADWVLLFTVNTKEEMDFLAAAFREMGIHGSVIDNRNKKDIYDGWAFFAVRSDGRFGH